MLNLKRICPKCAGHGEMECHCCGNQATCENCNGEGWIPVKKNTVIAKTVLNISKNGTITLTTTTINGDGAETSHTIEVESPLNFLLTHATERTAWYRKYTWKENSYE